MRSDPMPARRRIAGLLGCCGVVAVLSAGCVSPGVADQADRRLDYGMSTAERKTAFGTALDRARQEDATVTARATVSGSSPSSDASGARPCTGRVLHVTMVGSFPHHRRSDGEPVSGQMLEVDAVTGRVCAAHYLTGPIMLEPESVLLFTT